MSESMLGDDAEDEFTELRDAEFSRIDLVGKGANGIPFLIAKADPTGGLLPADLVHSLVNVPHNDPATERRAGIATERDDVTISGSPAAVAKMIHAAAQRASSRTSEKGEQMNDVTKADAPEVEAGDIVGDAAGGSTAESQPGSPDWEQLDADTALNAIGVLGRVKGALEWLAGREAAEAVTGGDGGDVDAVWDLEDAAAQIDCIIRRLAGFAATETLEVEVAEEIDDVTKAVAAAGLLAEPLAVLEQFGPVRKAGRVLSTANEQRVRDASTLLQEVLGTLPAAIVDDQQVAKGDGMSEPVEKELQRVAAEEIAASADAVEKAKGDPQMAVFDSAGKLVGTIDPGDLSPIAETAPPAGGDAEGEGDAAAAEEAPAEPVAEGELAPAPADAAGVPADAPAAAPAAEPAAATTDDDVAKADGSSPQNVLKEDLAVLVEAALKDHPVVKALEDRVRFLEAPAPPRVASNGFGTLMPPADLLRGQNAGGTTPDDAITKQAADLRERIAKASTIAEREEAQRELNEIAASAYSAMREQAQAARRR